MIFILLLSSPHTSFPPSHRHSPLSLNTISPPSPFLLLSSVELLRLILLLHAHNRAVPARHARDVEGRAALRSSAGRSSVSMVHTRARKKTARSRPSRPKKKETRSTTTVATSRGRMAEEDEEERAERGEKEKKR